MPLTDPIDMKTFEDTIHAWFSESIDSEVIWEGQGAPRPPEYPYGTLKIIAGPVRYSQNKNSATDVDLTREAGKEIRFTHCVPCYFDVSCQVFVKIPDSRFSSTHALNLVTRACERLDLMTVQDTFKTANMGVVRVDGVSNPGQLINDTYISRSAVTVGFSTVLSLEEYTGYFATAEIESTDLGIDQEIDLP